MKKLLYLLLLPLMAFVASCSDDDDNLPQVDFSITMSNVVESNGAFYAVKGDVVSVDQVSVKSLTDKNAAVTGVRYFLDGIPVFGSVENPFSGQIPTEALSVGTYTLNVTCTVLQVDKTIANAVLNYPLIIVASADDLPDGTTVGTYTLSDRVQPQK